MIWRVMCTLRGNYNTKNCFQNFRNIKILNTSEKKRKTTERKLISEICISLHLIQFWTALCLEELISALNQINSWNSWEYICLLEVLLEMETIALAHHGPLHSRRELLEKTEMVLFHLLQAAYEHAPLRSPSFVMSTTSRSTTAAHFKIFSIQSGTGKMSEKP